MNQNVLISFLRNILDLALNQKFVKNQVRNRNFYAVIECL